MLHRRYNDRQPVERASGPYGGYNRRIAQKLSQPNGHEAGKPEAPDHRWIEEPATRVGD
jgi:hypothetical protein